MASNYPNYPTNWYWQSEDGRVYSSQRQIILPNNGEGDKNFSEWKSFDTKPTQWPRDTSGKQTNDELSRVLEYAGLRMFPPTLDEVKSTYIKKVNAEAEEKRSSDSFGFGIGQSLTFLTKVFEARAYKKAVSNGEKINNEDYPLLNASIGVLGDDLSAVADNVLDTYNNWLAISTKVEAVRLKVINDINKANSKDEVISIYSKLDWNL